MSNNEMQTKIVQWGNSKVVRIPNDIVNQLELDDERLLNSIQDNSIILTPKLKMPKDIHELFNDWQDDGIRDNELDWGSINYK